MKKFKDNIKFSFTPDFQLEILRFILRDKEGGLVLKRLKSNYLVLIEHSLIFEGITKYFKKQGKMPSENILKEVLKELLESKAYVDLVTKEDIPNINKVISNLYHIPLSDADYIKEKIYQFSTYVEMKNLNDSFDLDNFEQYEEYSRKVEKVLQKSKPKKEDEPLYMIRDIVERQFKRQSEPSVLPCPFRQLNELTNAGGYPEHSVNVILDKPKAKKTFFMVNLARGYLRMNVECVEHLQQLLFAQPRRQTEAAQKHPAVLGAVGCAGDAPVVQIGVRDGARLGRFLLASSFTCQGGFKALYNQIVGYALDAEQSLLAGLGLA